MTYIFVAVFDGLMSIGVNIRGTSRFTRVLLYFVDILLNANLAPSAAILRVHTRRIQYCSTCGLAFGLSDTTEP